jgi:outer membrane protein assembly factor BamC
MKLSYLALALTAATLAGCSAADRERASGGFDYVNIQPTDTLTLPGDLERPERDSEYAVPQTDVKNAPVGQRVNITAPQQVRPLGLGSRVLETETETRVYFDIVEGMGDSVTEFVEAAVKTVLERRGISYDEQSDGHWLTETMSLQQTVDGEGGFLGFGGEEDKLQERTFRYEIIQETESHKRTTSLRVAIDDFTQRVDGRTVDVAPVVGNNLEAELLNAIISEVNRKQQQAVAQMKAEGIDTQLTQSEAGENILLVEDDFEQAWPLVNLALQSIGFEVEDLNRETGTYFVSYSEPDSGFLFIGGDDYEALGIEEGEYEFRLLESGDNTAVRVYQDDTMVSKQWLESIYENFRAAVKQQSKL